MEPQKLSRRGFLKKSAISGGTLLLAPLASPKAVGANDRIHFGLVGVGAMGTGHLKEVCRRSEDDNIRCLAVCDVYRRRVTQAKEICQGEGYPDS